MPPMFLLFSIASSRLQANVSVHERFPPLYELVGTTIERFEFVYGRINWVRALPICLRALFVWLRAKRNYSRALFARLRASYASLHL